MMKNSILASTLGEVFESREDEFMRSVIVRNDHIFSNKFNKKMNRIIKAKANPIHLFRIEHRRIANTLSIFAIMTVALLAFIPVILNAFSHGSSDEDCYDIDNSIIVDIDDIEVSDDKYHFIQFGAPGSYEVNFSKNETIDYNDCPWTIIDDKLNYSELLVAAKATAGSTSSYNLNESEFRGKTHNILGTEDNLSMLMGQKKDLNGNLIFDEFRFGQGFARVCVYPDEQTFDAYEREIVGDICINEVSDIKDIYFRYTKYTPNEDYEKYNASPATTINIYEYRCAVRIGEKIVMFYGESTGYYMSIDEERELFCKLISTIA